MIRFLVLFQISCAFWNVSQVLVSKKKKKMHFVWSKLCNLMLCWKSLNANRDEWHRSETKRNHCPPSQPADTQRLLLVSSLPWVNISSSVAGVEYHWLLFELIHSACVLIDKIRAGAITFWKRGGGSEGGRGVPYSSKCLHSVLVAVEQILTHCLQCSLLQRWPKAEQVRIPSPTV